jgi:hypothetical protein
MRFSSVEAILGGRGHGGGHFPLRSVQFPLGREHDLPEQGPEQRPNAGMGREQPPMAGAKPKLYRLPSRAFTSRCSALGISTQASRGSVLVISRSSTCMRQGAVDDHTANDAVLVSRTAS